MNKIYIGIDNGVTGSVGVVYDDDRETKFIFTPVKKEVNYTKKKGNISRLNFPMMLTFLETVIADGGKVFALLERPMVNPGRFKAGISAVRCLEATIIVLETLGISYQYCDSKEWQKEMLQSGIKGTPELKSASASVGVKLFPEFAVLIKKQGDADGLLMAEYARRKNL